ncbi:MAG TPA: O-antigen ligase family protein [Gemmata sp.]|nr:O-antigen ligase family protein [Gemmata sp.]
MKQFAFMIVTTLLGVAGSFNSTPLWGVAGYYLFGVLRPQSIWQWQELAGMQIADVGWSFYVAIAAILSTILWRMGSISPIRVTATPWYGDPQYTRSHYLFLMFVFWVCLTYPTARNPDVSYPFFIEYVKIFCMFICSTFVLRTSSDLWVIFIVITCAVGYAGYEINSYYFLDGYMILQRRGYGGLDNNGAGLMLAMGVPLALFAYEGMRHKIRWLFLLLVPFLLHAVMLSFSRGAMLSVLVCTPLIFLRARSKRFIIVLFAGAAVFVVAAAGPEITERFLSIQEHEVDESANARKNSWAIAIRMANEEPLFGFGIRNSNRYTYAYGADMSGRTIHSQYLQTAADSGWVALALYLALLGSTFLSGWQVHRFLLGHKDPESLRVRAMLSGLMCSLLIFCFGGFFLSLENFELPYILILLLVQLHAITRMIKNYLPAAVPR